MVQAKQMLNEVGVNPLQSAEEEGWKLRELLTKCTVTHTHTSLYYKISGQGCAEKRHRASSAAVSTLQSSAVPQ